MKLLRHMSKLALKYLHKQETSLIIVTVLFFFHLKPVKLM